MDNTWRALLWSQLGATIDMLENAVLACPDELILRQKTDSAPRWVAKAKSS